jgi:peptide/nickel transport system substrate-binding protein
MNTRTRICRTLIPALAVAVIALVAGCDFGDDDSGESGGGSTLRIVADEPQSGLDPATAVTHASARVMELIYDNLLDYDSKGELVPDLAESWQPSEDGTSYTFRLQPNAKFSDGSPVTAQDVKFSLERAAEGEALKASLAVMENVTVVDDKTVRVELAEPSRVFLNALARIGASAILSEQAVNADPDYFTKPEITSGPWRLVEYSTKDHLRLEANPHYFKPGFPKIKTIQYTFSNDPTSAAAALESGTADMYFPMAPQDALRLEQAGKINYYAPLQPGLLFWGLDKTRPPFDDVRVRQALAYMVPRDDRLQACWKGIGGVSYGSIILEGGWAFSPGLDRYKVSPEEALETASRMLDEAGWRGSGVRKAQGVRGVEDGASLTVEVPFENNWDQARCNTQLLQSALEPLGVDIRPQAYDPASFWSDVAKGKFTMYHGGSGWATDDDMMEQGFTSDGQSNSIVARWENPEFDELVEQAEATSDLEQAKELYNQAQQIILDQAPILNTGAQFSIVGATTRLHGFQGRPDVSNRGLIVATLGN